MLIDDVKRWGLGRPLGEEEQGCPYRISFVCIVDIVKARDGSAGVK